MLTISKAISSAQAQTYHKLEYTSDAQSYYKQEDTVKGEWQGKLATSLGLSGEVAPLEFSRLTEGMHPQTEAQMVRHREGTEYTNADGSITRPVEHRAGWDATFSAPKSVSLTALVGGDERVTEAHRTAVTTALNELEKYTHARIGGNNPAEVTGKFVAAKFEHDTARPVNGYAAPQLHTHAIIFNVTAREDGSTRAVQERTFFESQNYATAVYQSVLTHQLRKLGYEIEPGQSGAPQIKGYSQAYLDASSPRSQQIKEQMERAGFQGPEAAQIAAHATRDRKQTLTPAQVLAAHRGMAAEYGNQPERVVAAARERALTQAQGTVAHLDSRGAVAFAKEKVFEREAVVDERVIMREALRRGMSEVSFCEVQSEFQRRQAEGEFRSVQGQKYSSGRSFTTPETIADERANVRYVLTGQGASAPMLSSAAAERQAASREYLNEAQQTAIREVLTSADRVHGFQGLAGTGKTSALSAIREGAEQGGYEVEGFAPTSKAAGQLREAGIEANTLQSFLARQKDTDPSRHLYMLDESSLASTRQMRAFLEKIRQEDRVLVIGDTRQHQGVDAGRPFQQMQEAGMQTSKLDTIMRQKDPELLRAVQYLATNETQKGIALLSQQGRVTELAGAPERIAAIARDYAAKPQNTLIVSPDNRSRQQINEAVRGELMKAGTLAEDGRQFLTLSHRSDMTGPDRTWAAMYRPGDVVQYERGSKAEGIERGSFGVVRSSDAATNRLTVELPNGSNVEYDPKRAYGVNVYRETSREFATGDRIQFSAIHKDLGISNRDVGTITRMEPERLTVLMDGKEQRSVNFNPAEFRQFDHGYAVTSHSSQGLTADRVIVNIDTDSSRSLINNRLAYVAISRASHDARIYTNNAATLGARLATDVTKTAALDFTSKVDQAEAAQPSKAPKVVQVHEYNNAGSRLAAVAREYVSRPERSVIVAPDRTEREELTQLIRADLYRQGKLGRDAQAVPVLVEKDTGNKMRVESYAPGDKIHYKTGSPSLHGIPHDSEATVVSTRPHGNVLSVQLDATREVISYDPAQLRTQTRESRTFVEETREIAQGERIRFTSSDQEIVVRPGDLGTVTRIGQDHSMTVKLDSGKIAEVSSEKPRHIDYGYAVEGLKNLRVERVIATGDGLSQQNFQSVSAKTDLVVYTNQPQQDFSSSKEIAMPELAQPAKPQHDFGIGF
jgi:conjugative relaxase-like TrwC/TraI family protein